MIEKNYKKLWLNHKGGALISIIYFLKSLVVGIAISAPIGPVGMLCIRKILELGFKGGLSVGLGAAVADTLFALIAGAGFTVVSGFLLGNIFYIKVFGGSFLISLGIRELQAMHAHLYGAHSSRKNFFKLAMQTFFLTCTNPLTILSFLGIFTTIAGTNASFYEVCIMVFGIFLGSMIWWLCLSALVLKTRRRLSDVWIARIRLFSSYGLIVFGLFTIISIFFKR